jgi:putative serine protease PepD
MSEPDTNPQRQPANSDAEPSHPAAELSRVDRGQSDSSPTPADTTQTSAGVDAAAGDPAEPGATPASPAPAGAPHGGPVVPGDVSHGGSAATPPQGGSAATPPHGVPGPVPGPFPPSPWHPAHAQSAHTHATQHNQPGWTGNQSYPGASHVPTHQGNLGGGPPPVWAQAPTTAVPGPRPSRLGKVAAVGAAAVVLMIGSGVAGGLATWGLTHDSSGGKTYTAAPILNSADLPAIAASVENSVVSITTGRGEGSGVVMSADGYILTNNHVVASASGNTVNVVLANGKTAQARIVGTDPKTDLAVVKAQNVSGLVPAKLGDSDAMRVGDTVLALGSPLGLQGSVTAGIISARDRTIQASEDGQRQTGASISGLLQTDAPINPGNSGGALVNTRGEVIGINTAIATAGQGSGNIGVGFAIPSNKAKVVADALKKGEKISHPFLGVSVGRSDTGGALVNAVTPGSPADKAGLQQGDIVTRFDGKAINNSEDLVTAVQSGKVGDRVELTYTRGGAENQATATLAETS